MKTNKKILKSIIRECVDELLLENLHIPDFPDVVVTPNGSFKINKNLKVSNAKYSGFTVEEENKLHKVIVHHVWAPSIKTSKIIENAYLYLVGRNPELNNITVNTSGYNPKSSPMKDVVHGVISGIPIYDIYHFVVKLKGFGNRTKSHDPSKNYINASNE